MAQIQVVNPLSIKQGGKSSGKAMASSKDFNAFLGAVEAMGPAATTAGQQYGDANSATVLSAAFSGVSSTNAQMGGAPYMSAGYGYGGYGAKDAGIGMPGGGTAAAVPGYDGFSQSDMINTMNQNNLQLLELQATMQSNMQAWNTKSNILSADHRARMAMIEKFTARG